MPAKHRVYLLDPQKIPPETIAVTFAKTSRSPESFEEIAAELTEARSAEFHEKWVVGYGHASVAEHAILHIAVENLSRLAVETLESNRLASYTEKSTRYQKWKADDFFIPPELENHSLYRLYQETCQMLFNTYLQSLPPLQKTVEMRSPRREDESEKRWQARIRSDYIDAARFLLPAAALANVGVTINARALEHAICKMLSHPLAEVRALGEEIKQVARAEVPTLVKYADAIPYLQSSAQSLAEVARALPVKATLQQDWCQLVSFDTESVERILAAALYRFGETSYSEALKTVRQTSPSERAELANRLLGAMGCHDTPLRELEYTTYTFDLILDQGAYFELKRHRMMTQTPQELTTRLGYTIPKLFTAAGIEAPYCRAMDAAAQAYEQIAAFNPHAASYLVPNGFNRRVLLNFNFRTALHFIRLRTAPNAHFSMRRVAGRLAAEIRNASPLLGSYLPSPQETWQAVEAAHFTQV